MRALVMVFVAFGLSVPAAAQWWSVQTTGIDTNLRGVSVRCCLEGSGPSHSNIWVSGSNGVILHSTDDGENWKLLTVTGASDLDFRDIEGLAENENIAYVMSSGEGDKSRIYKTVDGGKSWKLQYSDKRPGFFLDSLACDSKTHCLALSDPVEGKFLVLSTDDGEHWEELPRDKMPAALAGEGAFAASGTSIALCPGGHIYFGTGGGKAARVFHSDDRGVSWTAVETPIAAGKASSGIFSVACGGDHVAVVGGDYKEPSSANGVAAYSSDSGKTWRLAERQPGGYRSAIGYSSDGDYVSVGTNGTDVSERERGGTVHWRRADDLNLNAVSFAGSYGWAVGPKGTMARFEAH